MREIKFRGKRDDTDWIYGYLTYFESNYTNEKVLAIKPIDKSHVTYSVSSESIGQYIGCKDKNGKEIYEGDIVQTNEAGWKAQVVYSYDCFMCKGSDGKGFSSECNWKEFEVIGNVYDNKDMLIKKENNERD